jgi:hypothetical protein
MSSDGTFIRAFVDSTHVADLVGDASLAYPGFITAMQPAVEPKSYTRFGPIGAMYGNARSVVVEFTLLPNNAARTVICIQDPSGRPPEPGESEDELAGSVTSFMILYQRNGQPPPTDQQGVREVPHSSVFGDWNALEFDQLYGHKHRETIDPCLYDRLDHLEDNSPGWPSGPQPLALAVPSAVNPD